MTTGEATMEKAANEKFCHECGQPINAKAEICPKCGVRQPGTTPTPTAVPPDQKNKTVAALLALLLGGIGIHKFYLGKGFQGILYIAFCWTFIPAVFGLIEGISYLLMSETKFHNKYG